MKGCPRIKLTSEYCEQSILSVDEQTYTFPYTSPWWKRIHVLVSQLHQGGVPVTSIFKLHRLNVVHLCLKLALLPFLSSSVRRNNTPKRARSVHEATYTRLALDWTGSAVCYIQVQSASSHDKKGKFPHFSQMLDELPVYANLMLFIVTFRWFSW